MNGHVYAAPFAQFILSQPVHPWTVRPARSGRTAQSKGSGRNDMRVRATAPKFELQRISRKH
jgi:hypothetical protein